MPVPVDVDLCDRCRGHCSDKITKFVVTCQEIKHVSPSKRMYYANSPSVLNRRPWP
jgi:hypothetical protein